MIRDTTQKQIMRQSEDCRIIYSCAGLFCRVEYPAEGGHGGDAFEFALAGQLFDQLLHDHILGGVGVDVYGNSGAVDQVAGMIIDAFLMRRLRQKPIHIICILVG